jgi:hypothetical protein
LESSCRVYTQVQNKKSDQFQLLWIINCIDKLWLVFKKAISGMPVQGFMCNFYELMFGVYIVLPDGTGEGKLWFLTIFRQDSLKNRR